MARAIGTCWLFAVFACLAHAGDVGDFPKGTFAAKFGDDEFAMRFDGKGNVLVTHNGKDFVFATYKVAKDEVTFIDVKGPGASEIGKNNAGRYKWKLDADKLSFTTIEDKAEGREKALSSTPWKRKDDAK